MVRHQHPWGRFCPGSWKRVRIVTEVFDEQEAVIATQMTVTTTTLAAANELEYTLRIDSTSEVAHRLIGSAPQLVRRGYYGESQGQQLEIAALGEEPLTIDDQPVASRVERVVIRDGDSRLVSMVHRSPEEPSRVLRQRTEAFAAAEEKPRSRTEANLVALQKPAEILSQAMVVDEIKIVREDSKGVTTILERHSDQVPGGVVHHLLEHRDRSGRLERRSTLELVDFGVAEPKYRKLFRLLRWWRPAIRRDG